MALRQAIRKPALATSRDADDDRPISPSAD
jgi:hypothetical protein